MKKFNILFVLVLMCLSHHVLLAQSLSQQQIATIENSIVGEMKDANVPGTAIAIINKNQIAYENHFGFANSQTKTELTDSTIYQIASVTKIFAALTLLTELEKAGLSPHDSVGNVIQGLSPGLSSITFHQLLTHTSGMIDYHPKKTEYTTTIFDFFKQNGDNVLFAKPGEVFSYSNTGYALIGLLIKQLSGKSYPEAVHEAVIKPLNLQNTTFNFFDVACKSFSVGHYYDYKKKAAIPAISRFDIPLKQAAGGIFSNLKDLERLALCLMNGGILDQEKIFKEDVIQEMSHPHAKNYTTSANYYGFMNYPNNAYGYGIFTFDYGDLNFFGNGGSGTQMSYFIYEPKEQFAMIVISNMSGQFLISSFKNIFTVVLGEEEPINPAYKADSEEWNEITGKYIFPSLERKNSRFALIKEKNGRLFMNFNNSSDIELKPLDNRVFSYSIPSFRFPIEIGFYRDNEGNIKYLRHFWRSWIKVE
ncbi:MAG: beta-lactamase family protein [Bacteroidales bacterium]|nr:beta-lactamase family protein [Bacteroidales bacterium]